MEDDFVELARDGADIFAQPAELAERPFGRRVARIRMLGGVGVVVATKHDVLDARLAEALGYHRRELVPPTVLSADGVDERQDRRRSHFRGRRSYQENRLTLD